ncbi:MAG: hypothetical protein M3143_12140 [Actinomycetota bacterium]|nr:hypothetical protein [Actinomycetota bacterium]
MRLAPIVAVRGKVCYIKGKGLVRSDTSKTSSALRSSHCLDSPLTGYAPGSPVKKIRCGRCSPPPAPTGARPSGGRPMCVAAFGWYVWRRGWGG